MVQQLFHTCSKALLVLLCSSLLLAKAKQHQVRLTYGTGQVYETYLDRTIFTGFPYEYITASYSTFQLHTKLSGYFDEDLHFNLALVDINSARVENLNRTIKIDSRFSTFFHVALLKKFTNFHFLYGTTSMITFTKQNRKAYNGENKEPRHIDQGASIDTNFSFAFFSFGLYFFPFDKIGFNIAFLDHNSNYVQGWFTTSVWLQIENESKLYLGTEILSRSNFGHGIESFLRSSASVFLRYDHDFGAVTSLTKLGIVLNPPRVDRSGIISLLDRFYLELGLSMTF